MKLIRARNVKSKEFRWNQIMNAAMKEFAQRPYQEITISQICNHLPFSRENLYKNYVKSKEEIFLIVLEKEFTLWVDSFLLSNNQTSDISPDEFAKIWANSLSKRKKLLSLLVILQTIIEKNVNLEQLTKFKKEFHYQMERLIPTLLTMFPKFNPKSLNHFIQYQYYLILGIYPSSNPTELQKKANKKAGINYSFPDFEKEYADYIFEWNISEVTLVKIWFNEKNGNINIKMDDDCLHCYYFWSNTFNSRKEICAQRNNSQCTKRKNLASLVKYRGV